MTTKSGVVVVSQHSCGSVRLIWFMKQFSGQPRLHSVALLNKTKKQPKKRYPKLLLKKIGTDL